MIVVLRHDADQLCEETCKSGSLDCGTEEFRPCGLGIAVMLVPTFLRTRAMSSIRGLAAGGGLGLG